VCHFVGEVVMKYRKLGRSGLRISEISLGGWTTFAASVSDPGTIRRIVSLAFSTGINFFDMADVYANGEAERQIGAVLHEFPRHHLVLSSKVYFPMSRDPNDRGLSRKHIHESARRSLQRLQTEYLDLYFAHRFDSDTSLEEVVRAFSDLVSQGLVLYWGTSEWPVAAIQEAIDLATQHCWHPPVVEQPEYSLLHRHRVEREVLPLAAKTGLGVAVWSPLAQGLLTGKYDEGIQGDTRFARLPQFTQRLWSESNVQSIKKMQEIAQSAGLTRAQLALAWVLANRQVTTAITGATRVEQLEENLKAAEAQLTPEAVAALERLFPSSPED
jgi:voltage-dependent potassium channel beta subunit